jgi:hypothetical protein
MELIYGYHWGDKEYIKNFGGEASWSTSTLIEKELGEQNVFGFQGDKLWKRCV